MKHVLALSLIVAAAPLTAQQAVTKPTEPGKEGRPALDDHERSPYFRSKETFTVPRLADGSCDLRHIPITPQPKGYSTLGGPFDVKTCTGVHYHMQFPPTPDLKADTTTAVSPSVWSGPDTLIGRGRQSRDVVNALRLRISPRESISTVTFRNDSTASVETKLPNGGATYTLHKKQGRWVVSDTSQVWVYHSSQHTPAPRR